MPWFLLDEPHVNEPWGDSMKDGATFETKRNYCQSSMTLQKDDIP